MMTEKRPGSRLRNRVHATRVTQFIVVHPMRGGMRRHSRWAVAAVAWALVFALAWPANARTHRRPHGTSQPAATTTSPPETPSAGTHSNQEVITLEPWVADSGKGGMPAGALEPRDVQAILGKSVRSSAGEDMGRLVDVVVDREGRPRAAIIDFGGFLGVGSRRIAVDWNALRFRPDSAKRDVITLELTRDQVKAAPEYKDKQPVVVLGATGGLQSLPNEWPND
jgi:sporulation protein YlmC with PRC-barrel domain